MPVFDRALRTRRLTLRRHTADDADALQSYYGDVDTVRYTPHVPWDAAMARDMAAARAARAGIVAPGDALALVVVRDREIVGDVMLWTRSDSTSLGEMGWAFHPKHRGQGFATEAVSAMADLAFTGYGMHRLKAEVDPRNTGSIRLCQRLGMELEGHLREDFLSKGEWCHTLVYGLLSSDWRSRGRPAGRST